MSNLLEIFKLPQSNWIEVNFKKASYNELLEDALEVEDYELAVVCRDWIKDLSLLKFKKECDCITCVAVKRCGANCNNKSFNKINYDN